MNRLSKRLSDIKKNNNKALVAYLVAGDPDIETTIDLMKLFVESGVDIIEIGVPFTDPIAAVSYTHLTLPTNREV